MILPLCRCLVTLKDLNRLPSDELYAERLATAVGHMNNEGLRLYISFRPGNAKALTSRPFLASDPKQLWQGLSAWQRARQHGWHSVLSETHEARQLTRARAPCFMRIASDL